MLEAVLNGDPQVRAATVSSLPPAGRQRQAFFVLWWQTSCRATCRFLYALAPARNQATASCWTVRTLDAIKNVPKASIERPTDIPPRSLSNLEGVSAEFASRRAALEAEVAARMGVVPNFFRPDDAAFEPVAELWGFARAAYLDNPLPALFKERLFVHLSRFCQSRYCIVRHVGFLVGQGHVAGAPDVPPQSVGDVITLLRYPGVASVDALDAAAENVAAQKGAGVPESGTDLERDVFTLAALLFLNPLVGDRARKALDALLGSAQLEKLIAFLAFVRTAHYWTLTHSSIQPEADVADFLDRHEALAELVLSERDIAETDAGQRLLEELEQLRADRDERAALRLALVERDDALESQRLLIDELNHRVKNTLAVVQSMVRMTLKRVEVPSAARAVLNERLGAIACAHDLLTREHWKPLAIDQIVEATLKPFRAAGALIDANGPSVLFAPKTSVAVVMALHELATNAVKYGALSVSGGRVTLEWTLEVGEGAEEVMEACAEETLPRFRLIWREEGGPSVQEPSSRGFGSMLIESSLAAEMQGSVDLRFEPDGLVCIVEARLASVETRGTAEYTQASDALPEWQSSDGISEI